MSNANVVRARLTGVSVEDSSDTSSPSGEQQAIVTFVREDTDVSSFTAGQQLGKALVWLQNNVPCPLYAANLHYFDLVGGPPSLPLARPAQPKVMVRKDASVDAGTTACWSLIANPTFVALATGAWGGAGTSMHPNDLVELSFYDNTTAVVTTKLGYFQQYSTTFTGDTITPGSLVIVTGRTAQVGSATLPGGYTYAWECSPLTSPTTAPAQISSGTGDTYVGDVYGLGTGASPTESSVALRQLQIDPSETLPAGTWVLAVRINGAWYMQAPVWLA